MEDFIDLYITAINKQSEDRAFTLYAAKFPYFTEETYVSFEDLYKPDAPPKQTAEEIIEDVGKKFEGLLGRG